MSLQVCVRHALPAFVLELEVNLPGQGVTAIFGRSGSGKTSLLRCIAGLEPQAQGRVLVQGQCWQDAGYFRPAHQRAVGYVFQEASLFSHLSVEHNLRFGWSRLPAAQRRIAWAQVLDWLDLGPLLARRVQQLSGGERQRVAIGRALLSSPQLLLLDEPLSALDVGRKNEILPYLARVRDELALPMLYVSHAPDEVARLADHLLVLEQGRVQVAAPLSEALAQIDCPIQLGEDTGVVLHAQVHAIDTHWHLAQVNFAGGQLWVRDAGLAVGRAVRLRILARDVSLALSPAQDSSFLNVLPAQVQALAADEHPASVLVRVQVGDSPVVARITQRSAASLGLAPGRRVWLQIKAVALLA